MSYVQPPLSFDCHPYSCVTCRYHRVEFGFIKNPPVSCHGRLFKTERLSAPDKKKHSCSYWNLNHDSPVSSSFACLLACSLARSLVGSLAWSLVGCCWLSRSAKRRKIRADWTLFKSPFGCNLWFGCRYWKISYTDALISGKKLRILKPLNILNLIKKVNMEELCIRILVSFRILLTMSIPVTGGEGRFSKLKLIKIYSR